MHFLSGGQSEVTIFDPQRGNVSLQKMEQRRTSYYTSINLSFNNKHGLFISDIKINFCSHIALDCQKRGLKQ